MSNLDYLIEFLQLEMGDPNGTARSEELYRRALVSGVKYLSRRWYGKYYIDDLGDVARSAVVTFTTNAPPIVEPGDEYAIVLAGAVILNRLTLTSSADSFVNWSTPDLSVSTGSRERTLAQVYKDSVNALEVYFKTKLAGPQKSTLPPSLGTFAEYHINRTISDVPGS
jgi:hypothetical protein